MTSTTDGTLALKISIVPNRTFAECRIVHQRRLTISECGGRFCKFPAVAPGDQSPQAIFFFRSPGLHPQMTALKYRHHRRIFNAAAMVSAIGRQTGTRIKRFKGDLSLTPLYIRTDPAPRAAYAAFRAASRLIKLSDASGIRPDVK